MVRLVAMRFTQVEGINFNEIFSFIAQIESIWVVLVVVAIGDFKVHQMDVKTVFLTGDLSEEIYM
jgi:hypothetical protein